MARKHRGQVTPLAAGLTSVLRKIGQGQPGIHPEIWARWVELVGEDLARRAVPRSLSAGVLTVAVGSSTWMSELTFFKPTLLERFAEEIGPRTVREIRLVLDSGIPEIR